MAGAFRPGPLSGLTAIMNLPYKRDTSFGRVLRSGHVVARTPSPRTGSPQRDSSRRCVLKHPKGADDHPTDFSYPKLV